mmetsp:Transcript_1339/g.2625  ORF Transcript_1339/g.2625 Transcript_1339/m.2625 type:complete len:262 (-) Transcript_1339:351-1136(-)
MAGKEGGELGLDKLLKARTKEIHREAHGVDFTNAFSKGVVSRTDYMQLLARYYKVYTVMEQEYDALCDPSNETPEAQVLRKLWFPEALNRVKGLELDLEYFYGPNWAEEVTAIKSEASDSYVAHLKDLANNNPLLLIAHVYTRYLGDLSGGQILKRCAVKAMKLPEDQGTQFYVFEEIESPKDFKNEYRALLDGLDLTADQKEAIAVEAIEAFKCSIALFREMDQIMKLRTGVLSNETFTGSIMSKVSKQFQSFRGSIRKK